MRQLRDATIRNGVFQALRNNANEPGKAKLCVLSVFHNVIFYIGPKMKLNRKIKNNQKKKGAFPIS
jgi:hypothetical protein